MPKYLSGRVKRTPQGSLTTDRYQYLGLDQAEPNLCDPANPLPNPPGGSHRPHIHPNALFSGVYYVKCNSDSGRLKIYDPRPGNQYIMPIRKQGNPGIDFWREANLQPIDGRIIMFPAWLWHSVEDNTSNDIRISISFNFIQEGFNG